MAAFPPVPARRAGEQVRQAVALIERRGRVLVTRREGPLLAGLWEPPGVEVAPRRSARRALAARLAELGLRARLAPAGTTVRHAITHRLIAAEVWRGELAVPLPHMVGKAREFRQQYDEDVEDESEEIEMGTGQWALGTGKNGQGSVVSGQ